MGRGPLTWTWLHTQLHRTLRSRSLLPRDQPVLVAVSGGQDSLCLIKLLLDLQPKWGWKLAIAHCNHGWRADSLANAAYIESLAQVWQLSCYRATASQGKTSEAVARQWRYQALTEIACQHGYVYVVTGHTASDRAETLLYNLIRGSGSDGLQALTWNRPLTSNLQHRNLHHDLNDANAEVRNSGCASTPLWLVRPLLDITRTQTGHFCQEQGLRVWEDSTNQDLHYARNRIRQELLPYLQAHFNPQVEPALAQTAELLQAEVEFLEQAADQLYQQALPQSEIEAGATLEHNGLSLPRLNRKTLRQAPIALQRRVIRRVLQGLLPHAPSFDQIEKLTTLITAPNRSQTDPFPGGLVAKVDDPWIILL
ncbi:MAG: tRNA lysidine(34) synthetase TilS [Microcoleaceae cyanobacterium]